MLAILIIAAVVILLLAVLYVFYYRVFYSPKKDMSETVSPRSLSRHIYRDLVQERIGELDALPCQLIYTRSDDGLRLSARYYEGDEDKPLFLCFHGYRGSALRDLSGFGLHLIQQNYPVILIDERAHWRSQGHTITFGIKERYDVMSWINFANRRFGTDKPIYLYGISMGGASVLMASGLELPENIRGIIADCPFNSPKDIIKHVCRRIRLKPDLCWPFIWLSALIWGRFRINATSAAREVQNAKKPILIIHGEADTFVPMRMSQEVAQANPAMTEMHTVPEAGHGLSYYYDTDSYLTWIKDFMEKTT